MCPSQYLLKQIDLNSMHVINLVSPADDDPKHFSIFNELSCEKKDAVTRHCTRFSQFSIYNVYKTFSNEDECV